MASFFRKNRFQKPIFFKLNLLHIAVLNSFETYLLSGCYFRSIIQKKYLNDFFVNKTHYPCNYENRGFILKSV